MIIEQVAPAFAPHANGANFELVRVDSSVGPAVNLTDQDLEALPPQVAQAIRETLQEGSSSARTNETEMQRTLDVLWAAAEREGQGPAPYSGPYEYTGGRFTVVFATP